MEHEYTFNGTDCETISYDFYGLCVVKLGLLTDEDSKVLSTLVLYLIVPSVILNAFQVGLHAGKSKWAKTCWYCSLLLLIILLLIVNLIGKLLNLNEDRNNVYLLFQFRKSDCADCNIYAWWKMGILCLCIYGTSNHFFFWTHCKNVLSHEKGFNPKFFPTLILLP